MRTKRTASSDRLWKVRYKLKGDLQGERLWVLSRTLDTAGKKALRWIRQNRIGRPDLHSVRSHGTIDVF